MKTLATLHAKELYDVIRFPADTSGKLLVNLVRNAGDTFYTSYGGRYVPTSTDLYLIEGKDFVDVNRALESVVLAYFVKGQAKVCIEVDPKNRAIVQAKLPCNRIVKNDPEMLTIIKNWARRKRLAVTTLDLEEVRAANVN